MASPLNPIRAISSVKSKAIVFAYILFVSVLSKAALAAPSPVFSSVYRDFRTRDHRGMVMRLPESSVLSWPDLYASLGDYQIGYIRVNLTTQPDCLARACQIGYFATSTRDQASLVRRVVNRPDVIENSPITLSEGIVGTYHHVNHRGVSAGPFSVVIWEQDGQYYLISLPGTSPTARQRIIDIAKSMASEKPVIP